MQYEPSVELGHPRNRILIEDEIGRQALVDTTGLTWPMLAAARGGMNPDAYARLNPLEGRPQDLLVQYAREVGDPRHMHTLWHAIPSHARYGRPGDERIRFQSFYLALRRWRIESARVLLAGDTRRSNQRHWGAGLLFEPGRPLRKLSAYTATTRVPPAWQVVPQPDVSDYVARWSTPIDEMTTRALRAGGLNPDEIAAEWPRSLSPDRSDRFALSPLSRPFIR